MTADPIREHLRRLLTPGREARRLVASELTQALMNAELDLAKSIQWYAAGKLSRRALLHVMRTTSLASLEAQLAVQAAEREDTAL
jgi:hypothetical protein